MFLFFFYTMAVICCQIHQIKLNMMMEYYQIFLLCLFWKGSQFSISTFTNFTPLKALALFVMKKKTAPTSWLASLCATIHQTISAQMTQRAWAKGFNFPCMHCVLQSTSAASPCRCRWWWRTRAAAASTAPSPLTTTSTPTPSSSSPASSATARGMSRGPGPSSSGRSGTSFCKCKWGQSRVLLKIRPWYSYVGRCSDWITNLLATPHLSFASVSQLWPKNSQISP